VRQHELAFPRANIELDHVHADLNRGVKRGERIPPCERAGAAVADPVKSGLVASLARPGGNVTGLSFMPDVLGAKGIELLREALPGISRMGALYQGDNPAGPIVATATEQRGAQLGLQFLRLPVRDPSDFAEAFQTATHARIEALFIVDDGTMTEHRREILDLAAHRSLPVVSIYKDFAEAGGLIAYGPDLPIFYRHAAYYVDRILKGAAPREARGRGIRFAAAPKAAGSSIPPASLSRGRPCGPPTSASIGTSWQLPGRSAGRTELSRVAARTSA